jgi:hypothetical protein
LVTLALSLLAQQANNNATALLNNGNTAYDCPWQRMVNPGAVKLDLGDIVREGSVGAGSCDARETVGLLMLDF